jgi:Ca-activated chloride channel homolog
MLDFSFKEGILVVIGPRKNGDETSTLPLVRTDIDGQINGPVASVSVRQYFTNPFRTPIEIEYLFPLPEGAAITDYSIKIGQRTIKAEIQEREQADRTYQEAKAEGKRASLLNEQRPNLFSLAISNVQPGEAIETSISYDDRLQYRDTQYEFVLPLGLTPKYHSPSQSAADAARTDAPMAASGQPVAPFNLRLQVDAGLAVAAPQLPNHPNAVIERQSQNSFSVALTGRPDQDFILRYSPEANAVQVATWATPNPDQSETMLLCILPPALDAAIAPDPREFIFVIDRSGSMGNGPMAQAKNALHGCLRALGENDTFVLQAFDDKIEWFAHAPSALNQENLNAADAWINKLQARGGTEIAAAVDAALSIRPDPTRIRYMVFLTDGAVSDEERTLKILLAKRGLSRVFTFGVGSSVNRAFLRKMAQLGRGTADFVGLDEDLEQAMTRFQDRVGYPALLNVQLRWQNANLWDTYPTHLPDLYVGQPLELITLFKRAESAAEVSFVLEGIQRGQTVRQTYVLPPVVTELAAQTQPAIRRLWAKARVDSLLDDRFVQGANLESIRQSVIGLGLGNHMLTPYTAFVATDSEITTGGKANTVRVAVPLPKGLDFSPSMAANTPGAAGSAGMASLSFMASPTMARSKKSKGLLGAGIDALSKLTGGGGGQRNVIGTAFLADLSRAIPQPEMERAITFGPPPIAEQLKALARSQALAGTWGDGDLLLEATAAALLAFVRAGHTTRAGDYRRQLRKTALWLQAALANGTGFGLLAAQQALLELDSALAGAEVYAPAGLASPIAGKTPPATTETLDDLRWQALLVGNLAQGQALPNPALHPIWLAVGQPR